MVLKHQLPQQLLRESARVGMMQLHFVLGVIPRRGEATADCSCCISLESELQLIAWACVQSLDATFRFDLKRCKGTCKFGCCV